MIIRDHFGYTFVSCQGTGIITSIWSHAPSLVVSVSKILSRSTGVGTTMGWVYITSIRSHAPSLVHNLSYTSKLWIRASSTETGYLRRGQFPNVKGDPLLPFLFKLRFSSALRDGIGVFKPISLLFVGWRALKGLCDMTLVHTAIPRFFFLGGGAKLG